MSVWDLFKFGPGAGYAGDKEVAEIAPAEPLILRTPQRDKHTYASAQQGGTSTVVTFSTHFDCPTPGAAGGLIEELNAVIDKAHERWPCSNCKTEPSPSAAERDAWRCPDRHCNQAPLGRVEADGAFVCTAGHRTEPRR